MKYRIVRADKHNWDVERYQEAGGIISRGRYSGQEKQARWMVEGHFNRLEHAAKFMVDKATGSYVEEGQAILDAITAAQEAVLEAVNEAKEQEAT